MSDSEIVYELVTSKYKIAERNRLAKYRFLNKSIMSDSSSNNSPIPKRRDSEPTTAKTERINVNLSVPGTPVSSRYVRKVKGRIEIDTDSEAENEDESSCVITKEQQQQQLYLQESLKKFTSDMKKLQSETTSHDALLENYFDSSDKTKTYKREFSEVASEITINKKDPRAISRVERYFTESTRRGSLTRDFNEVVQSFDPQNPTGREQFKSLSKPGTPISSKFIKIERVKLEPLNIKNLEKILDEHVAESKAKTDAPEKPKRVNAVPLSPIITVAAPPPVQLIPEKLQEEVTPIEIIPLKEPEIVEVKEEVTPIAIQEVKTTEKKSKRKVSNVSISSTRSDISVPGTPVSSRHIFRKVDDDDDDTDSDMEIIDSSEITALAQEFAVKIDALVQKTKDEEEVVKDKSEKKLLIIYDDEKKEPGDLLDEETANKVKEYLEKSEKESSYQRTFSEVAIFNEPSTEVKEKVEKYFKDSDAKKSLTRGFSEAINYIEPVDIEKLFKPGTPVSSKTVECVRKKQILQEGGLTIKEDEEIDPELLQGMEAFLKAHEALHNPLKDFKADEYFEESTSRKTLRRDFSEVFGQLGSGSAETSSDNPDVQKYFEQSEAQKSFQRQFSEALQTLPPRIKDILIEENKKKDRTNSVSSATSDPEGGKKPSNKYAVDKYFAASLYRTAFHRQLSERRGSEPNRRLAILEDEHVFGETDLLRGQVFVNDDETPIRKGEGDNGNFDQQNVQFWRDFLKPYNLNLPSDIVMRDELIDKYTKYTLE